MQIFIIPTYVCSRYFLSVSVIQMNKHSLTHFFTAVVLFFVTAVISFALVNISDKAVDGITASIPETEMSEETETFTEAETQLPTVPTDVDEYNTEIIRENFADTVIIGNSQAQALSNYGLVREADFITKVGLSINKVLSADGNSLINGLYGTDYKKVVFVFGENELGWPYPKNFISEYKKVISAVRNILPDAKIYCHSVFPVSRSHSEKSTIGITNENVVIFNGLIKEMCEEEGFTFIDFSSAFSADNGALPEGVANDGVHFNYDYCKIWASDLSRALAE